MNNKIPPNNQSLQKLKDAGWNIKIVHYRRLSRGVLISDKILREGMANPNAYWAFMWDEISPFGGATEMVLTNGDAKIAIRADCYHKDRFCRRLGVKACLDKLAKTYNIGE